MRGGISYIANRHGEANNKYMSNYQGHPTAIFGKISVRKTI